MLQKPRRTSQGYLRVDGWASRTGILEYRNPDGSMRRELREPDAVFSEDALLGFEGAPVTDDHPTAMVDLHNAKSLTKGTVLSVGRRDGDHVAVSLVITDPELIRKIESGKRQLSTGYYVEMDETPGIHPDYGRYDARQVRVGPVNHLAIVERGRAGTATLRLDAEDIRLDTLVEVSLEDRLDAIETRIADLKGRRDEWNEEDHPRDEGGRFGSGGGGGGKKSENGGSKGSGRSKGLDLKSSDDPRAESRIPGIPNHMTTVEGAKEHASAIRDVDVRVELHKKLTDIAAKQPSAAVRDHVNRLAKAFEVKNYHDAKLAAYGEESHWADKDAEDTSYKK